MPSQYPGSLDTISSSKTNSTLTENDHAPHHNELANAVMATQGELGTDPSGAHADVVTRLDAMQSVMYDALATDVGPLSSPQWMTIKTGTFEPLESTCELTVDVIARVQHPPVANIAVGFFYGTVSPPLVNIEEGVNRSGVTQVDCGSLSGLPGSVSHRFLLSGLTPGQEYNFEIGLAVVGFLSGILLPDTPIGGIDVSDACTETNRAVGALELGDVVLATRSATKLHISKISHAANAKDQLMTGAGKGLTASSVTGQSAVSPNGKRVLVTHYGLGKVSLYDIDSAANLANPSQVGSDVTVGALPVAAIFQTDDICWISGYGNNPGYVQKLTGCSGGSSPTAATAINLTGSGATAITQLALTPDGSKLLAADGVSGGKVWIINTATNGVTSVAVPSGTSLLVEAISNTKAVVLHGTTLTELTLSGPTFDGSGLTDATFTSCVSLDRFEDGRGCLLFKASGNHVQHIVTRAGNGGSAPSKYTSWAASATTIDGAVDDMGNIYVVTSTALVYEWYGSTVYVRPTQGLYGEKCLVTARPAAH